MRRILIYVQGEFNVADYFTTPLSNADVVIIDSDPNVPNRESVIPNDLSEGDAVMLIGATAFDLFKKKYHLGIRRENYYDCSLLDRLAFHTGGFCRVIHSLPQLTLDVICQFMGEAFTIRLDTSHFRTGILKDSTSSIEFLNRQTEYPLGSSFSFDYETSGLSFDSEFYVSGFSIANQDGEACFVAITDIRIYEGEESVFNVYEALKAFLLKHQRSVWVMNLSFETQVTWRELGIEVELCDGKVYNVMDGLHSKDYSLKWTAQRLLKSDVWDYEFDLLSGIINDMFFDTVPDGKSKVKTIKVRKPNWRDYKNLPQWHKICQLYPDYIQEFEVLIERFQGNQFMCIPSDILGKYCNLDAIFTLWIHLANRSRFTEKCNDTYQDNIRLGARLARGGMYKDENFRQIYNKECDKMMAYGITYSALVRLTYQMNALEKRVKVIHRYHPLVQSLMKRGEFHGGDIVEISKYLLSKNLDDTSTSGLSSGSLMMKYGEDNSNLIVRLFEEAKVNAKFKGDVDETIIRKKKVIGLFAESLKSELGLDRITPRDIDTASWAFYRLKRDELYKVYLKYFKDVSNIDPDAIIKWEGVKMTLPEFTEIIHDTYIPLRSPKESANIVAELTDLFKLETVWLSTINASVNTLEGGTDFYKNKGITDINLGFEHYKFHYKTYCENTKRGVCVWPSSVKCEYPMEIFLTSNRFWKSTEEDDMKTTWAKMAGYRKQADFFNVDWRDVAEPFDLDMFSHPDQFKTMRKIIAHIMIYKKYSKVKTTYIEGLFLENDRHRIDTDCFIPLRDCTEEEIAQGIGSVKMYPNYEVLKKETKRWSSPYHTIISKSDIKCVINTPPGHLLSYFDISSAEVRTAAYISGDPVMINLFETKQDPYIHVARIHFGEDTWNNSDKAFKKLWRGRFKTILLGVMYGMGVKTLASRLGVEESSAVTLIDTMFGQFNVLKDYIDQMKQWPLDHDGYIKMLLGDHLRSPHWKFVKRSDGSIDKGALSGTQRHGINYQIQSASAVSMASGFWNNIRSAKAEGFNLAPIIVVHDSNTNYFPIEKIFEIKEFYREHFTKFCQEQLNIPFLFDLLVGTNYNDAVELEDVSENTVKLSGNAHSLLAILNKIDSDSNIVYKLNRSREDLIPNYVTDPIERFIKESGTSLIMDKSFYEIEIQRIR